VLHAFGRMFVHPENLLVLTLANVGIGTGRMARSSASDLPRRQIAITRASVTSCAVIPALIDQPTTRCENASRSIRQKATSNPRTDRYERCNCGLVASFRLASNWERTTSEMAMCDSRQCSVSQAANVPHSASLLTGDPPRHKSK